jgi:hypothetical protein
LGSPATEGLAERTHDEAPLVSAAKYTSPPPELKEGGVTVKLEMVGVPEEA